MLVLLSAAFDMSTIYVGFRGTALGWLESYLTDRTQFVLHEGSESKHCKLRFGVPQGSVLGPFFAIYMLPLGDVIHSVNECRSPSTKYMSAFNERAHINQPVT